VAFSTGVMKQSGLGYGSLSMLMSIALSDTMRNIGIT
jgi:hypothetical protein